MAGHGSPPPEDKGNHPNRKVGRTPEQVTMDRRATAGPLFGYDREMKTRSRLEDEYGGGAGDWDH